jgi:hypothetical protein
MSEFKINYQIQLPTTIDTDLAEDNSATMHDVNNAVKIDELETAFDLALSLVAGTANVKDTIINTTRREEFVKVPKVVDMLFDQDDATNFIFDIKTSGKFQKIYYIVKFTGDLFGNLDDNTNWTEIINPTHVTINGDQIEQVKIDNTIFPGSGVYTVHINLQKKIFGSRDFNETSVSYEFTI